MARKPRNPAPAIFAVTLILAGLAYYLAGQTGEDLSGARRGTALLIVVAVGVLVIAIALRRHVRALRRHAELEAIAGAREAAAAGAIDDPRGLSPQAMFMVLAIEPVDERTLADLSGAAWGVAERSQNNALYVTVLIVALMVPALVMQEIELVVLAAVPIVLYAVFLAVRVIMPGGELDQAYAAGDGLLRPLGLAAVERPEIMVVPRLAGDGAQTQIVGPTVFGGVRHGRAVEILIDGPRTHTQLAGTFPLFELQGKAQRLAAKGELPRATAAVLEPLKSSPYWTGVKVKSGPEGILVQRKTTAERRWLYDLWLAERLAGAL